MKRSVLSLNPRRAFGLEDEGESVALARSDGVRTSGDIGDGRVVLPLEGLRSGRKYSVYRPESPAVASLFRAMRIERKVSIETRDSWGCELR